jgi:hypothetical protein
MATETGLHPTAFFSLALVYRLLAKTIRQAKGHGFTLVFRSADDWRTPFPRSK